MKANRKTRLSKVELGVAFSTTDVGASNVKRLVLASHSVLLGESIWL